MWMFPFVVYLFAAEILYPILFTCQGEKLQCLKTLRLR
jgi:hypothetical protein